MKKSSIYILIILIVTIVAFVYMSSNRSTVKQSSEDSALSSQTTLKPIGVEGVEFGYPASYDRYDRPKLTTTKTLGAVVFYEATEDNRNFFLGKPTPQKEVPTTITLDVYENTKNLPAKELLKGDTTYPILTQTVRTVTLSGKTGEYFEWDGLYRGRSIAVNHQGKTYIFSVTSITQQDKILKDFDLMLTTVYFK